MKVELSTPPKSGLEQKKGYWTPDKISFKLFQLSDESLPQRQREMAMRELSDYVDAVQGSFLGYQATQKMEFGHLDKYLNVSLNNIGDSFSNTEWENPEVPPDGYFTMNNKWMERAVLDYYANLWNAKPPRLVKEDEQPGWLDTYWGYVVSMGSTEGNLLAMRNGRDYLNGTLLQFDSGQAKAEAIVNEMTNPAFQYVEYCKASQVDTNPNALTPVLFFSDATHYSIKKLAQILQIKTFQEIADENGYINPFTPNGSWPKTISVKNDGSGSVDVEELIKYAEFFIKKGYPIIVNFNYGTTWTGGYDNVGIAVTRLTVVLKEYNMYERVIIIRGKKYKRAGFWFHVDGALGAAVVPFLKKGRVGEFPEFDFKLEIQSISMSGHKWMGIPWPCGVYMTKNKYLISNDVPSYVGSLDSTLAGSRNGFSGLLMWDYLSKRSYSDQIEEARAAIRLAEVAERELRNLYPGRVSRAPGSLAVIFPKPKDIELLKKYALASSGDYSHIFIMRHVTSSMIFNLIDDLKKLQVEKPKTLIQEESTIGLNTDFHNGW